jgi:hypothetical protein
MKKIGLSFLFALFGMISICGYAQSTASNPALKIGFKALSHDFGKIPQGKPVFFEFEIANQGTAPVALENVMASCGCTTPEWSTEPIAIGKTATIKVGYNSAAPGPFEKTIQVAYGGGQMQVLTIKGNVWKTPDQPAPANKSLALLKTLKSS